MKFGIERPVSACQMIWLQLELGETQSLELVSISVLIQSLEPNTKFHEAKFIKRGTGISVSNDRPERKIVFEFAALLNWVSPKLVSSK